MPKFIFRKIGGRVIPIKISSEKAGDSGAALIRRVKAEARVDGETKRVATLFANVPKKGLSATLENVDVAKPFRRKGISRALFDYTSKLLSRALFDYTSKLLSRAGKKFLRSDDIQAVAQVRIRAKRGWFKAGKKTKNLSRFLADQFGPYGEETRRVSPKMAVEILKENRTPRSTGRLVRGTTMIRRKKK